MFEIKEFFLEEIKKNCVELKKKKTLLLLWWRTIVFFNLFECEKGREKKWKWRPLRVPLYTYCSSPRRCYFLRRKSHWVRQLPSAQILCLLKQFLPQRNLNTALEKRTIFCAVSQTFALPAHRTFFLPECSSQMPMCVSYTLFCCITKFQPSKLWRSGWLYGTISSTRQHPIQQVGRSSKRL